jgi:hypothetical protein
MMVYEYDELNTTTVALNLPCDGGMAGCFVRPAARAHGRGIANPAF